MTRPELFARIAATTLLSKADAASAPGAVLAAIVDAISRGQTVAIPGFDRFTTWNRPARTGRHPRAGETSAIAAESVPGTFRTAKALRDAINEYRRRRTGAGLSCYAERTGAGTIIGVRSESPSLPSDSSLESLEPRESVPYRISPTPAFLRASAETVVLSAAPNQPPDVRVPSRNRMRALGFEYRRFQTAFDSLIYRPCTYSACASIAVPPGVRHLAATATIAPVERRSVSDAEAGSEVATAMAARAGPQRDATTIRTASSCPRRPSRLNAGGMAPEDLKG